MPADDGSEPINVATDLNDNLEKIDSVIGFVPATSAVDPTNLYDGIAAYETDTGRAKFRKGGVWNYLLAAGASFLSNLHLDSAYRIGIGTGSPGAIIDIALSSVTAAPVLKLKQFSEATHRLQIDHDGIRIGGGATAPETRIYRPTTNQLAITGSVSMANDLSVTGSTSLSNLSVTGTFDVDGTVVGDLLTSGKLSGTGFNVPNIIRKPVDTARSATTTTADDPHFTFAAEANSAYFIQIFLYISSNTTADFKSSWTVPSGSGGLRWVLGEAIAGTDYATTTMRTSVHQPTTDVAIGGHSLTLFSGAMETAVITTAGTAGPITFKWAQNTSDANPTNVRQHSIMIYRKVE
jgi:hypothetical protein